MANKSKPTAETAETAGSRRNHILTISAPAGPRRRNGFAFGPVPVDIPLADLGDDAETLLEAWRADPYLKVDGRVEEAAEQTEVTDPSASGQ